MSERTSSTSTSSVLELCQCAICFEVMRDPKTLQCEHSFCKECLEGCVVFKSGNIPSITCPTCRAENELCCGETVSDLKAQLILKQILDGIQEFKDRCQRYAECCNIAEKKLSPRCCPSDIEWYCWNCKSFFCKRCFNLHSLFSTCPMEFYEVKYSEAYDTYTLFCGKHKAFHSHGCLRCTSTFCNYCIYETHNKEPSCIIVSFKEYASKFKGPLLDKIDSMKNYKAKQKSLLGEIDGSSLNIESQKELIKKYVDERKIVVLSQVLFLLELTGKQVLNNFDSELKEYESATVKLQDQIDSKLKSVEKVLKKSEILAESSLMEVISQTKELQDEFHSVLPEDILEEETNLPELQVQTGTDSVTNNSADNLLIGIQGVFGDMQLRTMKNDGNHESTEMVLNNDCNNIDYSSSMFKKLNSGSESRKYALKVLKKLGILKNMEIKSAPTTKETGDQILNRESGHIDCGFSINQCYVKVCGNEDSTVIELLSEPNDTLLISKVQSEFPNATGLKFQASGSWQGIRLEDGMLYPPTDGWNDNCYYVSYDKIDLQKKVVQFLGHNHPLRLMHRKKWNCQVCSKDYSATKSYFCAECKYDACCECVLSIATDDDGSEVSQPAEDNSDKEKKKKKPRKVKKTVSCDATVEKEVDGVVASDGSDDSLNLMGADGQSSNQINRRRNRPQGGKKRGKGAENQRGGATGFPFTRVKSNDSTTTDVSNDLLDMFEQTGLNGGIPSLFGQSFEMPENYSNNETDNTRGGGGNNVQRGGRGGRPRGKGYMQRGGRGRGRGNMAQPDNYRGCRRGGPNRGQPGGQRGRGLLNTPGAHQRPTAAASLGSLTQCYKCGNIGHIVSNCPQGGGGQ